MINFLLTLLIAINTSAIALEMEEEHSIQVNHDHAQELIKKLHQYVIKEGIGRMCTQMHEMIMPQSSMNDKSENVSPGTLLIFGTSENDIHAVIVCLEEGRCAQIISQNGNTEQSICHLTDLDFNQFPYRAAYHASDVELVNKFYSDYLEATDAPSFLNEKCEAYFVNEQHLPLVLFPKDIETPLENFTNWAEMHQDEMRSLMASQGGILLRGFPINRPEDFAAVVRSIIGRQLVDYKGEGSRHQIIPGVYTSTEAPLKYKIPLHNELSCTPNPVEYICFYCEIAPESRTGQTILAKTESITSEINQRPHIWNLFKGRNIKYICRHPPEGNFFTRINPTHRTWQQAFETSDKNEVERICNQKGYDFKWDGDWIEITKFAPAIRNPDQYFDRPYWFNQAHLYHSNPRIRGGWINHLLANLVYMSPSTRQYDVEFEDGSAIPRKIIYEIYDILDQKTVKFDWKKGDILLLDNLRAMHGRAPSKGQRRILVTMVQ